MVQWCSMVVFNSVKLHFPQILRAEMQGGSNQASIQRLTRHRPAAPTRSWLLSCAKLDLRRSSRPDQVLLKATPRELKDHEASSWSQLIPVETVIFCEEICGWMVGPENPAKESALGAGFPWIKLCWGGMAVVPTRGSPHLTGHL